MNREIVSHPKGWLFLVVVGNVVDILFADAVHDVFYDRVDLLVRILTVGAAGRHTDPAVCLASIGGHCRVGQIK